MAFEVTDFRDLVRLLEEHPEWRADLRRLVLTDELLELPAIVRDLAEQLSALTKRVDALTRAVDNLTEIVRVLVNDVGWLKGLATEEDYRKKAFAYFGRIARRLHVLDVEALYGLLDPAVAGGRIAEDEAEQIRLADIVARGRREDGEIFLVVEVSFGVGRDDVDRARDRAALLSKAGVRALPVVAGRVIVPEIAEMARLSGVWQVADGKVTAPDAA